MAAPDYDDLNGIDLSQLDLDDIDLEEEPPSPWGRRIIFVFLVGLMGFLLWVPTTEFYQVRGGTNWLFFTVSGGAIVVGLLLGRFLWRWAQEAAERYAARRMREAPKTQEPRKPPAAWVRWLTLLAAIGGGIALLVGIPAAEAMSSTGVTGGFSSLWFLMVLGALAVAALLGRWLMMQGEIRRERREPAPPIQWPPWLKWVTLGVLLTGGLVAGLGMSFIPPGTSGRDSLEFGLGAVAFVVGVLGAIWLARRFDETEEKIKERAKRRPRGT